MQTSKISRILWPLRRSPHPMERRRVDEIDAQLDRTPQNCFAFSRSGGQPQIPSPVRRIAPKPSRLTNRSPPNKNVSPLLPVLAAVTSFDNPPVRTPAAPPDITPKKVLRLIACKICCGDQCSTP